MTNAKVHEGFRIEKRLKSTALVSKTTASQNIGAWDRMMTPYN